MAWGGSMKKGLFLLSLVVTFFIAGTVSASAVTNDVVKVGLRYGSSVMSSANLENDQGSGYEFGYFTSDRTFVSLGETDETTITMAPVSGGIQVTVMIFVLLPFAKILFPKAGIPWYLFPGITGLAIATFAMGQMPGSLQMQNIIPTQILGTALTAAPVEGVLATLFMIVVGVGYLYWQVKKGHDDPEAAIELYQVQGGILDEKELEQRAPGFWISLLPMVVTFVLINGFGVELLYGLTAGCVLSLLFFCKSLGGVKGFGEIVSEGFNNGIFPCIIIAAVVGVGKVVSATDVFALVQENIINLPLPGLVKVAAITTIIAGITGSASGGLTIALELFGETFISWGYTPEIIHRVASIACGGLDTLPWNGTVVMLFALSGVSYKKGYKHVAMETVILPLLSLIPVFIYYSIVH